MELSWVHVVKTRLLVQVIAFIVVAVFAGGIWLTGGRVDAGWLRFFSAAVLVSTGVLWLWDRVLWKIPVIQRIPPVPRNISGTWQGTLESSWDNPATTEPAVTRLAYLVVRQTASSVSAIQLTAESKSSSSVGAVSSGEGMRSLDYIYFNRPGIKVEQRSRMHHGSASLEITGRPATRLRGRYWTDRDTKGQLDFSNRKRRAVDDFEEAQTLFSP
jgi:hypothetical protein